MKQLYMRGPLRILIADDERMARVAIVEGLKGLPLDIEIEEASNGIEMQQKLAEFFPHIAFVDIRMPLLDGLKAIREVKGLYPHSQWIILSGHTEFSYAKEAITLNVHKYLVKPVSCRELRKTVEEAADSAYRSIDMQNAALEQNIRSMFRKEMFDPGSITSRTYRSCSYLCSVITLDQKAVSLRSSGVAKVLHHVRSCISRFCDLFVEAAAVQLDDRQVLFVCTSRHPSGMLPACRKTLEHTLDTYPEDAGLLSACMSSEAAGAERMFAAVKHLQSCTSLRLILDRKTLLREELLDEHRAALPGTDLLDAKLQGRRFDDEEGSALLPLVGASSMLSIEELEHLYGFLCSIFDRDREEFSGREELSSLLRGFFMSRGLSSQQRHEPHIERALDYVHGHYREDIGVNTIAPLIGISPNYLSTKFKKATGVRFVEYVTKLRIEKARELLTETSLYIREIAGEVGYHDVRHFSNTFEQYTGYSPSNYRSRRFSSDPQTRL